MAGNVNKVFLLGNLGKDPETKNFENGGVVCSFPIATTESYWDKEKNQRIDLPTDWHNIRISKPGLAKVAQQYLRKGSQVLVEGNVRYRSYQTKEGETKYFTEIHVDEMTLLGKGTSSPDNVNIPDVGKLPNEPIADIPASPEDDLPF